MLIYNFFILFILFCFLSLAIGSILLAPWLPTWKKDLARIFKLANLKAGEIFYELGCGNGKVVIYAAKNYNIKAIGIELGLPLYLICKFRQLINHNKNIIFKWSNFYQEDLRQADVVYLFGRPQTLKTKLTQKLEKDLKSGARIISYAFPIEGWQPKVIDKPTEKDITIYLYQRP